MLKWRDVNLDESELEIVDREEFHTKTRCSRTVALRRETAEMLLELKMDQVNQYVLERPEPFYASCKNWFRRLVKEAGLDYCTLHDLRKTTNALLLDSGTSREGAMQILGHTSAQTNERYYTGALLKLQRQAVDSLPSIG